MEAIDTYYDEIVEGMKLEHMPPQEIEVMRELGSSDPEAELSAMISIVKSRCKSKHSYNQEAYNEEVRVGNQLKNLVVRQFEQLHLLATASHSPPPFCPSLSPTSAGRQRTGKT